MKKISAVVVMSLAMVLIMAFTCYAQTYWGCFQKSSGQLRVLTEKKDTCRQTEVGPIQLGGAVPEVPVICAGYINCRDNSDIGVPPENGGTCVVFNSSCITEVYYYEAGQYKISFANPLQSPICVFYIDTTDTPGRVSLLYTPIPKPPSAATSFIEVTLDLGDSGPVDVPFNFICTEP